MDLDCIKYIEQVIDKFDKIILIPETGMKILKRNIIDNVNYADFTGQHILVLSAIMMDSTAECFTYRKISRVWEEQLVRLYYSYEFTDNFVLLDESTVCPTLLNFVKTGILTAGEALQALLR